MSHRNTPHFRREIPAVKYEPTGKSFSGTVQKQVNPAVDSLGECQAKLEANALNFLLQYTHIMPKPTPGEPVPAVRLLACRVPPCQMDRKDRRELARYIAKCQIKEWKKQGYFDEGKREHKKMVEGAHAAGLVLPGDLPSGQAPAVEKRSPGGIILP